MTTLPISETFDYPLAPWSLQGKALISFHAVDIAAMQSFLPATLEILPIFPGKTLGGLYLSSYEDGSVLTYNELIVFCGLVRYGDRISAWVTHIYVDQPQSVAGGQNIWGLPKQLASFQWSGSSHSHGTNHSQVTVSQDNHSQDNQMLCRLSHRGQLPGIPTPIPSFAGTFSLLHSQMVWSSVQGSAKTHLLTGVEVEVPRTSPFAALNLTHPTMAFHLEDLNLRVLSPTRQALSV